MKVQLITTYAGPLGTWMAGTTVDLPDKEAKGLVAGGYATRVEAPATPEPAPDRNTEVETATVAAPEKAVTRGKGKRNK